MGELSFDSLWESLLPVGLSSATGGYDRLAYTDAELRCRDWFMDAAKRLDLDVETDRNGNMWAWWTGSAGDGAGDALVIGSHLDSVRNGGAYDGPLGVVSALAAVSELRSAGFTPSRPLAVVVFADEEGARFGVACTGSRLMTGQIDPDRARSLIDESGTPLTRAMWRAGHDPRHLGPDDERVAGIGAFIELHIEQGKELVHEHAPVGLASGIWPHGRFRFTFTGEANHAGTTRMADRRDPVSTFARTALSAEAIAQHGDLRATFGRIEIVPNSTNAVPSGVRAWLDARAGTQDAFDVLVSDIRGAAAVHAGMTDTDFDIEAESVSPAVSFDADLRGHLSATLADGPRGSVPVLSTGAGHDAGVLASAGVPSAMLFVRNPTGVSHSPHEHAERDDCLAGVDALTRVVRAMAEPRNSEAP